jgi:AcrR family transcriptional regulator
MGNPRQKDGERSPRETAVARANPHGSVRRVDSGNGREEEFLTAALVLFAERNFASVTIKDIAHSLGVNTALIYYYFENKTDLFRATIEFAVENAFTNMRALEERNAEPAGLISAWLENHVERYAEIHRFVKIALDYKGSHEGDAAIEASIASFYARELELLSRYIRKGVEQRIFKPVDPRRMAQFISTYLDGCMVRSVILADFNLKTAVGDLHRCVLESLGYRATAKPLRTRR